MAERIWHPISKLDFLVDHTASWLGDVRENAATLRRTIYAASTSSTAWRP